jgi:hypothetical protein
MSNFDAVIDNIHPTWLFGFAILLSLIVVRSLEWYLATEGESSDPHSKQLYPISHAV